jgi:hypothetical protein
MSLMRSGGLAPAEVAAARDEIMFWRFFFISASLSGGFRAGGGMLGMNGGMLGVNGGR